MLDHVFLQGLLLDENIKVRSIYLKNYIKKFHTFCKINKITPLEACIRFIKNYKIDCMILGFDNFLEMKKAIKIFKRKNKKINFPKFICQNHHKVIEPRVWKK